MKRGAEGKRREKGGRETGEIRSKGCERGRREEGKEATRADGRASEGEGGAKGK